MKPYLLTVLDILLLYAVGYIVNSIFAGELVAPTNIQLIAYIAIAALIRSNRKGGAA